ncbi:Argininosuccinate lyase [Variovorax sp. PBL-H6]|uniref:Bug family tripartite tricarboxylate transporter substrate binding protein n=1 Tax=Variovorax sp. PBL-H6 TaxID=434009 RepID=UPI001316E334|nr:tripartite tricarboxylate transporter substrate-binding protein [Variovorax sp. PBL-H6]VTU32162.1 Argininosuccinate lyase [Variovorax sp. PBL-H6]
MLNRRHLLSLGASAALPLRAFAQDPWPARSIRAVNPGAAGGTNDVLTRHLLEPLGKLLGQPVILESKAGAGGVIGTQFVAQQPADGYTILTHHNGFITAPLVSANANYDALKDFVPLSLQGTSPLILIAHPSMPPTLAEFVAHARANPGKLEWGTAALGGVGHLATEVFHDATGIKGMVKVAFSGSAPATQALVAGQIKYLLSTPTAATAGLVQEGRLRFLGVSSAARSPLLPNLPSISEVAPGFAVEVWFGLLARAGTPPAVVARLADAIASVISQPDIIDKYRAVNVVARPGRNELAELLRGDHQLWSKVVREKNIRLD